MTLAVAGAFDDGIVVVADWMTYRLASKTWSFVDEKVTEAFPGVVLGAAGNLSVRDMALEELTPLVATHRLDTTQSFIFSRELAFRVGKHNAGLDPGDQLTLFAAFGGVDGSLPSLVHIGPDGRISPFRAGEWDAIGVVARHFREYAEPYGASGWSMSRLARTLNEFLVAVGGLRLEEALGVGLRGKAPIGYFLYKSGQVRKLNASDFAAPGPGPT